MLGFLRRKKETYGPFVYLSEPTFLYNTRTEKAILELIEEKFNSNNILVPSDYGLRDTSGKIPEAEIFVAVAPLGKFTTLVGREVKIAMELGKPIYTLLIAREADGLVYVWSEGVPEEIEWLGPDESIAFSQKFAHDEYMAYLKTGLFVGSRKREW
jgi:hypothetical protein